MPGPLAPLRGAEKGHAQGERGAETANGAGMTVFIVFASCLVVGRSLFVSVLVRLFLLTR